MRYSPRWVAGNVLWFSTGGPWGLWRVEAETFHYLPDDRQAEVLDNIRAALLSLPGESMLLSIQPKMDPVDVYDAMVEGIDLEKHPAWQERALEAFTYLDGSEDTPANPAWTRIFYIAAELSPPGAMKSLTWRRTTKSGEPSVHERDFAEADAQALHVALGRHLGLTPTSQRETEWLYERAMARGLYEPACREDPFPEAEDELERLRAQDSAKGFPEDHPDRALFKEGGDRHDGTGKLVRRYLKVTTFETVSFQAYSILHRTPWNFNPGELLRADLQRFPVDWCLRITSVPNADAIALVKKKLEHLTQQGEEREAEIVATGQYPGDLARAIYGCQELRDHLVATNDPLHGTAVIFCVWGPTAQEAEQRAVELKSSYAPVDYRLQRPTGAQYPLFTSMLPGPLRGHAAMLMAEYRQHLLPADLSKLAPCCGLDLGDRTGLLFAESATAEHRRLVMVNPSEAQREGRSGSLLAIGHTGSGKSVMAKILATAVVDQGGMVCGVDLTSGEWVRWLEVQQCRKAVVRLTEDPTLSLDPLRVFAHDLEAGRRYALGLATMITGCDPRDDEGTSLKEAIEQAADRADPSMPLALEILSEMAGNGIEGARQALRHLNAFARRPKSGYWLGALVFDLDRKPLDLRNLDALIFHAPGLSLPSREQMLSENLNKALLPEQIHGLALLYAVAAVQRAFITLDPRRFAVAIMDEVHNYTCTIPGRALISDGLRGARKDNGAIWVLSQHPADVDSTLASQFEYRFMFGQARGAGLEAAGLLGLEALDDLRRLFEEEMRRKDVDLHLPPTRALCLMRDTQGRVGLVRILPPTGQHAIAYETNPARMIRELEDA